MQLRGMFSMMSVAFRLESPALSAVAKENAVKDWKFQSSLGGLF